MKRTLITLAIASTLGLGGIVGLQAGDKEGRGHGGRGMHGGMHGGKWGNPLERLTKDLDLTADQEAKVQPILDQTKPQMDNDTAQIRPLLTPDQQQRFDAMKKAHEDMMQAHRAMKEARQQ